MSEIYPETPGVPARNPYEAARRAWDDTGDWEMAVEAALAARRMAAAQEPQPAPGELPKGYFDHLQAIGIADNLRGQLRETRAALSALLDRTEGSSVLTEDERDDYRRVILRRHAEPQPAPELADGELFNATQQRQPSREVNLIADDEREYEPDSVDIPCGQRDVEEIAVQPAPESASQVRRHAEQGAPELRAAMRVLRQVLEWFQVPANGGANRTAIVTRAQLASAYLDGGLNVPEELRPFLGKRREGK